MQAGAITSYIDVAQVALYGFWAFFAGLIFYLRREDKREGYPLISDRSDNILVQGFPPMPRAKSFLVRQGHEYLAPPGNRETRHIAAEPLERWPGAPLYPTGDPMRDGVGPASWAERDELPEVTAEGETRVAPMRIAGDFVVESNDPDPRGMEVVGADNLVAGVVTDLWVDRSEPQIRYLQVEVPDGEEGPRSVLLPLVFTRIDRERRLVKVKAIMAHQFAHVPGTKYPDEVSLREEDRIVGYYGGGYLYAEPSRQEPVI